MKVKTLIMRKYCLALFIILSSLMMVCANASAQTWTIEAPDSPKSFSSSCPRSIALDSSGNPHLAYGDTSLYYASFNSSTWDIVTVDSSPGVGQSASLAIDSAGKAHISYYDQINFDLKYATNATGSWVLTTVDSAGSVGNCSSLTIDSAGKAHISYQDSTNEDFKYATNATGSWVLTTVDNSAGPAGSLQSTSLALDSTGKVHISYRDRAIALKC
ncbi:MAG: hypothetical protein ACUZ8E_06350 [Candidatus Anammoxibacter sp.]